MTSRSVWNILGIAPTNDAAAIRKAYSSKLKVTQPEDDPEAFKALRAAYESAFELAKRRSVLVEELVDEPDEPPPAESIPNSTPIPAPTPAPVTIDPSIDALDKAFRALQAAIAKAHDPEQMTRIFADVLHLVASASVQTERAAELHVASMLAANIPSSDPLLARAAERFGWRDEQVGDNHDSAVAAIVARLRDLAFLESLESGESKFAGAFERLQHKKIPFIGWIKAHRQPNAEFGEYQLLQAIRVHHSALLSKLNPAAVEWWDRLATRPQLAFNLLAVAFFATVIVGAIDFAGNRSLGAGLVVAAVTFGLVFWKYLLLDWPRHLIVRKWRVDVPLAIICGWLPLSFAALALAIAFPSLPIVWSAIAVIALQWAALVRLLGRLPRPVSRDHALYVDGLLPQVLLSMWWMMSIDPLPAEAAYAAGIPFFALMVASAIAASALRTVFLERLDASQRVKVIAALGALTIAVAGPLWTLWLHDKWNLVSAAIVLAILAVNRPISFGVTIPQQKLRLGLVILLVVGWFAIGQSAYVVPRNAGIAGFGTIALATTLVNLGFGLWNERRARGVDGAYERA